MGLKTKAQDLLHDRLYNSAYTRARFTLYGQVVQEIKVSFSQFFTWRFPIRSFFRTLSIILSSLIRLLLGRSLKYSFSHTGEDRILESIYKPLITTTGFYVDVGCNHPTLFSNTYSFYRRGWRGVCIDANPTLINRYKYYRPRDLAICAIVSNTPEKRDFFLVQNDVLSTTERQFVDDYIKQGMRIEKIKAIPRTLTSLLDELNAPASIDILTVDVEEHDYPALLSLDLNRYQPRLIAIEDETFDWSNPEQNNIYSYLTQSHYRFLGFILKNLYFRYEKR